MGDTNNPLQTASVAETKKPHPGTQTLKISRSAFIGAIASSISDVVVHLEDKGC